MIDLSVLNNEQKEAVLDNKNNLLLLACAGSGKTLTVTYKIAYAIEKGFVKPHEVCAVTFTNRACKEMQTRIEKLLPTTDTSSITIRTFHSLCATLLRRFGFHIGLEKDFTIYDDDDSFELLKTISNMDRTKLKEYYKYISRAKDFGLDPDSPRLNEISREPDFRNLYKAYNAALRNIGNVDFGDLIALCVELLEKSKDALAFCHNRFKLIIVDEYQDSNGEQFKFLKLFASPNSQLVAVGDDDQSIYSFRGADIRNILSFSKDFKDVREIKLEKNYRSTDEILSASAALIKHNEKRHDKEIVSADGKKGRKPVVLMSNNAILEATRVISLIEGIHDYSNCAILYRTNAQSLSFETELARRKIPYKVVGALKFYEREEIKDCLAFLRLLINPKDQISFRRIINKPSRKLGAKTVNSILDKSLDTIHALSIFINENKGASTEGARVFYRAVENAKERLQQNVRLGEILTLALEETELIDYYKSETDIAVKHARLENLSVLVSALEGSSDTEEGEIENSRAALSSFLEKLSLDSTVIGSDDPRDKEGVTLITMHNTKGLEYDTVFCVGLEQQIIPGGGDVEEERRIMYVAMTRARKKLYLSYATNRMVWGKNDRYRIPSSFLKEIPISLLTGDTASLSDNPNSFFSSSFEKERTNVTNIPSWANGIVFNTNTYRRRETVKPKVDKQQLEFKEGDRVRAPGKGDGFISGVEKRTDKTILTVTYDDGRVTRYVAGSANIEKI